MSLYSIQKSNYFHLPHQWVSRGLISLTRNSTRKTPKKCSTWKQAFWYTRCWKKLRHSRGDRILQGWGCSEWREGLGWGWGGWELPSPKLDAVSATRSWSNSGTWSLFSSPARKQNSAAASSLKDHSCSCSVRVPPLNIINQWRSWIKRFRDLLFLFLSSIWPLFVGVCRFSTLHPVSVSVFVGRRWLDFVVCVQIFHSSWILWVDFVIINCWNFIDFGYDVIHRQFKQYI